MSTNQLWLPPLNKHDQYSLKISAAAVAAQDDYSSSSSFFSRKSQQRRVIRVPRFAIRVNLSIDFCSNSYKSEPFKGLSFTKDIRLSCSALIRSSPPQAQRILSSMLSDCLHIPFPLHRAVFTTNTITKHYQEAQKSILSSKLLECLRNCSPLDFAPFMRNDDEGNWIENFQEFLRRCVKIRSFNSGRPHILCINLKIDKLVGIDGDDYMKWISWYAHNKRNDPNFERDYEAAISRPRTDEELSYGVGPFLSEKGAECVICLRGLAAEPATCWPCTHIFHVLCFKQWLQRGNVCPVCRYSYKRRIVLVP